MTDDTTMTQIVFSIGVIAGAAARVDRPLVQVAAGLDDAHRQAMYDAGQALIFAVHEVDMEQPEPVAAAEAGTKGGT